MAWPGLRPGLRLVAGWFRLVVKPGPRLRRGVVIVHQIARWCSAKSLNHRKIATIMGLFNANLFRSFAIGFALGAVAVAAVLSGGDSGVAGAIMPAAVAAPAQ